MLRRVVLDGVLLADLRAARRFLCVFLTVLADSERERCGIVLVSGTVPVAGFGTLSGTVSPAICLGGG